MSLRLALSVPILLLATVAISFGIFKYIDSLSLESQMRAMHNSQVQWLDKGLNSYDVIELSQADFENGTVVIDDDYWIHSRNGKLVRDTISTDGVVFRLTEDIEFNPNKSSKRLPPHFSGYVRADQYEFYDPRAYGIGFFAAITVQADNVIIDLNDRELAQSREHSLQQRFYANIELSDQPFIPEQGPANFGESVKHASRVAVINGRLGRSAHHGIHGQLPTDVLLQDLEVEGFEVAGISLHGAKNVSMKNVDILGNRTDIEVMGLYSAMRFMQPYIWQLPDDYSMVVNNQRITKQQLVKLFASINDAVVNDSPNWRKKYPYVVNEAGLLDGNVYGLVFNNVGVAVNGFPNEIADDKVSTDIYLEDVVIQRLAVDINETPALALEAGDKLSGAQNDVVGAILQTYGHVDDSGHFTGTYKTAPIQIGQVMIAKAIEEDVDFGFLPIDRNSIFPETISWVEGKTTFADAGLEYVLNGDSMHHVNKGIIGAKIDGSRNVAIVNMQISDILNQSERCLRFSDMPAFYPALTDAEKAYDGGGVRGIKGDTLGGAGMNFTRGMTFSGTKQVSLRDVTVDSLHSKHGPSIGVDVMFDSSDITASSFSATRLSENRGELPMPEIKSTAILVNEQTTNNIAF